MRQHPKIIQIAVVSHPQCMLASHKIPWSHSHLHPTLIAYLIFIWLLLTGSKFLHLGTTYQFSYTSPRDNARHRTLGSSHEFPRNFRESNGTVAVNPGWILASGCRQYSVSGRVRTRAAPHQCTQRHGSFYGI